MEIKLILSFKLGHKAPYIIGDNSWDIFGSRKLNMTDPNRKTVEGVRVTLKLWKNVVKLNKTKNCKI